LDCSWLASFIGVTIRLVHSFKTPHNFLDVMLATMNIEKKLIFVATHIAFVTAFAFLPTRYIKISTRLFDTDHPAGSQNEGRDNRRHLAEFLNLEPLPESEARRERLDREKQNEYQYAKYGNDLWDLRATIQDLSVQLVEAIDTDGKETMIEQEIRKNLRQAERRDPELVYRMELEAMQEAARENRDEDVIYHKDRALNARSCLDHFNLEGLWVGK
jgi:hypothetical protein